MSTNGPAVMVRRLSQTTYRRYTCSATSPSDSVCAPRWPSIGTHQEQVREERLRDVHGKPRRRDRVVQRGGVVCLQQQPRARKLGGVEANCEEVQSKDEVLAAAQTSSARDHTRNVEGGSPLSRLRI